MTKKFVILFVWLVMVTIATADWQPGDRYKMHFPQLPDEEGWNVNANNWEIADDWLCDSSGAVSEIHFWGSWMEGQEGDIALFNIRIYEDIPDPDPSNPYTHSMPGEMLWMQQFDISEVIVRQITPDPELWQGWYDPATGEASYPDHSTYYQYNIVDIQDPFMQQEGEIYWLGIQVEIWDAPQYLLGWKTTLDNWNDNAVYYGEQRQCYAPDNGQGTVDLPPNCEYYPVDEPFKITDGLPNWTTIECQQVIINPTNRVSTPGGPLGGEIITFDADLHLYMTGTGDLEGFFRSISIPVLCEIHIGPRTPGEPVQTFASDFYQLYGNITGDPDFDDLSVMVGTNYGLSSPGMFTLCKIYYDLWWVESFFDISYQIDFTGAPGSVLDGYSGTTIGTSAMNLTGPDGEPWAPMYEPDKYETVYNSFAVTFDAGGIFLGGYGDDAYGDGWYYYPDSGWWNIWFYDHPFTYDRYKEVFIDFNVVPFDDQSPRWIEVAVNWSTDAWSLDQPPGDSMPPLPGENEQLYIGRHTVFESDDFDGHYYFEFTIPDYNPEWISVDVRGYNFDIAYGTISHTCLAKPGTLPPLDLAFVINETDTCEVQYLGDVNNDGTINIQDLTYLVSFLYNNGPAPPVMANADLNGDCCVDYRDVQYFMQFYFSSGPPPVDCTCQDPPLCIPEPAPFPDGEVFDNTDGYRPPDGDPTGTVWHELYDTYCQSWAVTNWSDADASTTLSVGDTVHMSDPADPATTTIRLITCVTTTLELTEWYYETKHYIELVNPSNPNNDPLNDPVATFWHESWPNYCRGHVLAFWNQFTTPPLQPTHSIFLQALSPPDSGQAFTYTVDAIKTDFYGVDVAECDCEPGNADGDVTINILDITYLISYLYKDGPSPIPYLLCSGDADCSCTVNILDITYLISFLYKEGPVPCTCEEWLSECGPPLRK